MRATRFAASAGAVAASLPGVVLACALALVLGATPAYAASWTAVANPGLTPFDNVLFGVDATGPARAWAVGYADTGTLPTRRPMIQRWNGGSWQIVAAPTLAQSGQLHGVDARSASDAWAVGYVASGAGGDDPLILRWDGTRWRVTPSEPVTTLNYLLEVKALAADDAWAVGYGNVPGTLAFRTLTHHWDGTAWTPVKSPSPENTDGYLHAVDGTSGADVWAVGHTRRGEDGVELPLVMRWTGAGWNVVPTPPVRTASLQDVVALAPDNVWAVGWAFSLALFRQVPYVLHWNGAAWREVAVPAPSAEGGRFFGVTALAADRVYAVGEAWGPGRTLVMRWNGGSWVVESTAAMSGGRLYDATAAAPGSVTAVGERSNGISRRPLTIRTGNG